jgi:hypothetical protein
MTDERDIERILEHWLADGPSRSPDRIFEAVAERIERQPQRPAWRIDLRTIDMNKLLAAAAIAAVLVVAVVAGGVIGRGTASGVGAPAATPEQTPKATASTQPTSVASPVVDRHPLRWSFVGTLPEGWTQDGVGTFVAEGISIEIQPDRSVMASDCQLRPEEGIGKSAKEIVDALAARPGLDSSDRQAATIGGLSGEQVDLIISPDWTQSCPGWDPPVPVVPLIGGLDEKNYWHYNAALTGEEARLYVLDVPGDTNVLIAVFTSAPASLADHLDETTSIVEGLTFEPPQ